MRACLISIVVMHAIFLSAQLNGATQPIVSVQAIFDVPQRPSLSKSIETYLDRYKTLPANVENQSAAEAFLNACYFAESANCYYEEFSLGKKLSCKIATKRIVKKISIRGLPLSILQSELLRKFPLEIGQLIKLSGELADALSTIKTRTQAFLRKNGYYGALAEVAHKLEGREIAINVNISKGVFALVNDIKISGDPPISTRVITKIFKRMCLRPDRISEAAYLGTYACYSRELEREAIAGLQDRMARLGYVQAHIRLSRRWVDPEDNKASSFCKVSEGTPKVPKCINLRLEIDKGPKVSWSINVKDRLMVDRNGFLRFIAALFAVDQFSRATVSANSDEIPNDEMIVRQELLKQITFISAKNVDEQEIADSASNIRKFLVGKGYVHAEVIPNVVVESAARTVVNFDVYAGHPFVIRSVQLMPSHFSQYVTEDELATLVDVRSILHNGHLSYEEIDTARVEIERRLNTKGFVNAKVVPEMITTDVNGVQVIFHVESSSREIIDKIVIINGIEKLNEEVVPLLSNCDGYKPHNKELLLCHNSSFVPDKIKDDNKRIEEHYQNNGFLYAKVAEKTSKTQSGNVITFTVFDSRFGESPLLPLERQNIEDIIISGNESTRADVIRRLFPKPRKGSILDPISLKKGLANLRESGRFSRIDHKVLFGAEASNDGYFLLQVTEKPSLSLDVGVAFSTDQLFSLETEIEETNLFSSLLKLNTSLGLGLFWGRQSILKNEFTWPFILGKPVRLTIQAPMVVYDDRTHWENKFRRVKSMVSLFLEWRLTKKVSPFLRYRLQVNQRKPFTAQDVPKPSFSERLATLDGLIPTLKLKPIVRGVLKPGISYVDLDDALEPHRGLDMSLWTEFSGGPLLLGDPPFVNVGTKNRFFIPLGPLTLALQATFMRTFIEPSKANWDRLTDFSEAMDSLGGDRTVRGYEPGKIGIYDLKSKNLGAMPGYFVNIANIELRFPITKKSSLGSFSGAIFSDQGMLIPCSDFARCMDGSSLKNIIDQSGFGLSVGLGLTYNLPVGPVSVDYGISPLTGKGRFHFLFGFAF